MRASPRTPFPHHAWFGYWDHVPADEPLVVAHRRQVTHCLMYLSAGRIRLRSLHRGHDESHRIAAGAVSFLPADGEIRSLVGQYNPAHDVFTLLIPRVQAARIAAHEGQVWTIDDAPCFVAPDDAILQACMARLASRPSRDRDEELRKDEAARRLLLRIQEVSGGGVPDWHHDVSTFDRATLLRLVDYVDAHLRLAPTVTAMGMLVALSPSHFAKKFRHTTGYSLQRFVNRRRVQASFVPLQGDALLAHVAFELGFSSQSHFTRIFSALTGMTPARYRRQFRRTSGWRAVPEGRWGSSGNG